MSSERHWAACILVYGIQTLEETLFKMFRELVQFATGCCHRFFWVVFEEVDLALLKNISVRWSPPYIEFNSSLLQGCIYKPLYRLGQGSGISKTPKGLKCECYPFSFSGYNLTWGPCTSVLQSHRQAVCCCMVLNAHMPYGIILIIYGLLWTLIQTELFIFGYSICFIVYM